MVNVPSLFAVYFAYRPAWPLLHSNQQTEQLEGRLDFDFIGVKVAARTNKERIAKWKQLAVQAEHRGELAIAKQWRKLADELEASIQDTESD